MEVGIFALKNNTFDVFSNKLKHVNKIFVSFVV